MNHKIDALRARMDELNARASLMFICGYAASGWALRERAWAVERQILALEVGA